MSEHLISSLIPLTQRETQEKLCPECFKVVGDKMRYRIVCLLGKEKAGMNVNALTDALGLTQPTVTHHLSVLFDIEAVRKEKQGREHIYTLNRDAHCFLECNIPY